MAVSANFAWVNRQVITHLVRQSWKKVLGKEAGKLSLIYDVAHNIAKMEKHRLEDKEESLCVHRKGATRAFGPGRPEIPEKYRDFGQPVIIPGSMGTSSYILAGTDEAMHSTFGTVCHGAGRVMSRSTAKKKIRGRDLRKKLEEKSLIIRCKSDFGLAEEAPEAYKDIDNVVNVVNQVGLAKKVARLKPLGVVKG